ncbi:uncharacterized protein V6R79_010976 [Siganus canaliculatus]
MMDEYPEDQPNKLAERQPNRVSDTHRHLGAGKDNYRYCHGNCRPAVLSDSQCECECEEEGRALAGWLNPKPVSERRTNRPLHSPVNHRLGNQQSPSDRKDAWGFKPLQASALPLPPPLLLLLLHSSYAGSKPLLHDTGHHTENKNEPFCRRNIDDKR